VAIHDPDSSSPQLADAWAEAMLDPSTMHLHDQWVFNIVFWRWRPEVVAYPAAVRLPGSRFDRQLRWAVLPSTKVGCASGFCRSRALGSWRFWAAWTGVDISEMSILCMAAM
jgi:hypothetical protein